MQTLMALCRLLVVELGSKLTSAAATGCVSLLNYIGGAQIYIKAAFLERMTILEESWKLANDSSKNEERMATASMEQKGGAESGVDGKESGEGDKHKSKQQEGIQNIPTTFKEMFQFNAAVMGFGQNLWMNEILDLFDNIMSNFANVGRVQEECSVLTIRMSKVTTGKVSVFNYSVRVKKFYRGGKSSKQVWRYPQVPGRPGTCPFGPTAPY